MTSTLKRAAKKAAWGMEPAQRAISERNEWLVGNMALVTGMAVTRLENELSRLASQAKHLLRERAQERKHGKRVTFIGQLGRDIRKVGRDLKEVRKSLAYAQAWNQRVVRARRSL